jgi:hypothetical protein
VAARLPHGLSAGPARLPALASARIASPRLRRLNHEHGNRVAVRSFVRSFVKPNADHAQRSVSTQVDRVAGPPGRKRGERGPRRPTVPDVAGFCRYRTQEVVGSSPASSITIPKESV